MSNNETSKVKSHCLRVPRGLGEAAIKLASRIGILNRDLKVSREDDYILIPIAGLPTEEQLDEIRRGIQDFEVVVREIQRREKTPKNIIDFLGDRLPPHLLASIPRSIDFVGDLAILEIPEELEPYKRLVGEAVLNVFKRVRSVLAKSSAVGGTYRLREYEVIAGSENTETVHREYGCIYHLDPRKVYFSPRLSYEHFRIASQVGEGETVIDMFAGVGPFSILIAKAHKNVLVYSIDINPNAIEYLTKNIYANDVYGRVIPILGDAREIIRSRLRGVADRVIMNLPERAIEYIDAACSAIKPSGGIIHYYEFSESPHVTEDVKGRISEAIKGAGRRMEAILSERSVKEVAPFKWQIAIDIKIR